MATTLLITRPRAHSFLASQGTFLVFTAFTSVSSGPQTVHRKHSRRLHPHSEPWKPCPEPIFSPACSTFLSKHSFLMLQSPFSKGQSHPSCICLLLASLESLTKETDLFPFQILKSSTETYSKRLQEVRDKWQCPLL